VTPRRYTKRPVGVEAWGPLRAENIHAVAGWCGGRVVLSGYPSVLSLGVPSDGCWMVAHLGDYVIRDGTGGFYPCRGDIFAKTYAEVVEAGHERR
jgi:hypothetical protein